MNVLQKQKIPAVLEEAILTRTHDNEARMLCICEEQF
jgi:hypothetical protein